MFRTLDVPILGVIENMRGEMFGSGGGEDMARIANVEFLGAVPMESTVRIGGDSGKPIVESDPEFRSSTGIHSIAQQVAAKISIAAHQNKSPEIEIIKSSSWV